MSATAILTGARIDPAVAELLLADLGLVHATSNCAAADAVYRCRALARSMTTAQVRQAHIILHAAGDPGIQ